MGQWVTRLGVGRVLWMWCAVAVSVSAQERPNQARPGAASNQARPGAASNQARPGAALANIVILATGGTIAGTGESSTTTVGYKAATVGVDKLVQSLPELHKVARIRSEQVFQIASENMTSAHWLALRRRVVELVRRNDVQGIVVTHGTDTLEETAYFLHLTVPTTKPIVLVGSMRPSTAISADGPINLYDGVALAGSKAAIGRGVMVMLNSQISCARDVAKVNTTTADTFRSLDFGHMGYVQGGKPSFYYASTRKHTTESEFSRGTYDRVTELPRVDIVYGSADSRRTAIDALVAAGVKGIVVAGTGNGSLSDEVKAALRDARQRGVVVVRSSRTGSGIVARNGEANDDELGFVAGDSLSPQKARILLSLALTKTHDLKAIQQWFWTH
jgi:L-asparaginase